METVRRVCRNVKRLRNAAIDANDENVGALRMRY